MLPFLCVGWQCFLIDTHTHTHKCTYIIYINAYSFLLFILFFHSQRHTLSSLCLSYSSTILLLQIHQPSFWSHALGLPEPYLHWFWLYHFSSMCFWCPPVFYSTLHFTLELLVTQVNFVLGFFLLHHYGQSGSFEPMCVHPWLPKDWTFHICTTLLLTCISQRSCSCGSLALCFCWYHVAMANETHLLYLLPSSSKATVTVSVNCQIKRA